MALFVGGLAWQDPVFSTEQPGSQQPWDHDDRVLAHFLESRMSPSHLSDTIHSQADEGLEEGRLWPLEKMKSQEHGAWWRLSSQ